MQDYETHAPSVHVHFATMPFFPDVAIFPALTRCLDWKFAPWNEEQLYAQLQAVIAIDPHFFVTAIFLLPDPVFAHAKQQLQQVCPALPTADGSKNKITISRQAQKGSRAKSGLRVE